MSELEVILTASVKMVKQHKLILAQREIIKQLHFRVHYLEDKLVRETILERKQKTG